MSIVVETFLICDGCGKNFGIDNRERSSFTQRLHAKSNGWKAIRSKDYCPNCIKQGKPKKP